MVALPLPAYKFAIPKFSVPEVATKAVILLALTLAPLLTFKMSVVLKSAIESSPASILKVSAPAPPVSSSLLKVRFADLMLITPSWNPVTFSPFHVTLLLVVFTEIISSLVFIYRETNKLDDAEIILSDWVNRNPTDDNAKKILDEVRSGG